MTETLRAARHSVIKWAATVAVLLIAIAALLVGFIANAHAIQTSRNLAGSCRFWKDIAVAPLPVNPSQLGLTIVADSRRSYIDQGCSSELGTLSAADARLFPFLPVNER